MFGGQKDEDDDIWSSMFGGKKESSSGLGNIMGGGEKKSTFSNLMPGKENSTIQAVKAAVPGFQEEPACAKCCPDLTFKQVCVFMMSLHLLLIV
jgi:hypothetical protein